ncbi:MAG: YihY/virulence factor BrkB family protein [Oscillospiraceae bacterium]|nr:YihY/virulence factor BrkB family protein [Oscillospiraceae bacterium]
MKYYRKILQWSRRISSYRVSLYAANASFYIVLSIFPAIALLLGLLPLMGFSAEDLQSAVGSVIPDILRPILAYVIADLGRAATGAVISVSALMAIWSASRGVYCIQSGLNAICSVRENRPYLLQRLMCMLYMVLLVVALLLTMAILVFGRTLIAYLRTKHIPLFQFLAKVVQLRGLILLCLLSLLFAAIYYVFPNRRTKVRHVLPGALSAALGWLVFTSAFSYYVRRFNDFSRFYGSLSTLVLGMLWLYFCMSILFYGQVLNLLIERRRSTP